MLWSALQALAVSQNISLIASVPFFFFSFFLFVFRILCDSMSLHGGLRFQGRSIQDVLLFVVFVVVCCIRGSSAFAWAIIQSSTDTE